MFIWKHKLFLGWVENMAGKDENAGFQRFPLFPQCFQKASFSGLLKVGIVLFLKGYKTLWEKEKMLITSI